MSKFIKALSVIGKAIKAAAKAICRFFKKTSWVWIYIGIWIWLFCIIHLVTGSVNKDIEFKANLAALESQNQMYADENAYLKDELEWFRERFEIEPEVLPE
jgi:hypothetical protein